MKVMLTHNTIEELEASDIGLGYIAASLLEKGHDTQIWLRNTSDEEFCKKLLEYNPDIVGIKILSSGIPLILHWIELIRKTTNSLIIIAGPHITGDPQNVLSQIPADYAFQGDGDRVIGQFVDHLEKGDLEENLPLIKGLIYRKDGGYFWNAADDIKKLDELPFPAWQLMPPKEYDSLFCKDPPAANIMITRGCTHKCSFCTEGLRPVRYRSVENVISEIKLLVEDYGVREIQFVDSNFLFTKKYIMKFCNAMLDSGLKVSCSAPNGMRLEWLDEESCEALAKIGFYRCNLGIESGSEEILDMIDKRAGPDTFYKKVPILRKNGILPVGNFMLGFPGETKKQMKETLKLALSLDLTGANFSIYTPLPGTRLFEELVASGKLESKPDYRNYNYVTYENNLSELSAKQLRSFRNYCIFRFIFRWSTFKTLFGFLINKKIRRNLVHRLYGMYIQKHINKEAYNTHAS